MKDNRKRNLFWLLSEDYNIEPNLEFIDEENINKEIFYICLLGYSYRKYDTKTVLKIFDQISNKQDIFTIFMIILDNNLTENMLQQREGLRDFYRKYIQYLKEKYYSRMPQNISEEIEKCHYTKKITTTRQIREIVSIAKTKCPDTITLVELLLKIIEKYFHEYTTESQQEFEKIKKEIKPVTKTHQKITTNKKNTSQLEKYTIGSQEFTEDLYSLLENETIDDTTSTQNSARYNDVRQNIEKLYGKSIVDYSTLVSLKNKLSTDIHQDINFHIVDSNATRIDDYRKTALLESTNQNIIHYKKNLLIYNRQINLLKETLQLALLKADDVTTVKSTNGTIDIKKAWRYKKFNDNKIFKKTYLHDNKPIAVDLLLDMSASQADKKEIIASQAYVIAKALSQMSIDIRVTGFNNMYDYLIITKFKDYKESNCYKIFSYHPEGSNRDGLALKFARNIIQDEDKSRLLIMLSDGKPNNIVNLNFVGKRKFKAKDYTGETAIKDASKEVFLTRLQNIKLLGVFTGKKDELTFEKEIFQTDFCYIKTPEEFSKIVGSYIKNIISNI